MRGWAIITGAGSGIGAALTHRLLQAGISVVAVGRRQSALERTAAAAPAGVSSQLKIVATDISSARGQDLICGAVPAGDELQFLVHNAAVGDPSPLGGHMDVAAAWARARPRRAQNPACGRAA